MIEASVLRSLIRARAHLADWIKGLPQDARAALSSEKMAAELVRLSYVDGYLRIAHTTPMILAVIKRLDAQKKTREAGFWIAHLSEEAFHDRVMRADLSRLLGGSKSASSVLRRARITPPSATLLGYFAWQIAYGNPSLLIALRLFLEWYIAGLEEWRVTGLDALVDGGSCIISTHRNVDQDHVKPCFAYVARHCRGCMSELHWSIESVGERLRDSQLYLAKSLLGRSA